MQTGARLHACSVSCSNPGSIPTCNTDALFQSVITTLRAAVPRPMVLSLAAYSIGAYGWGTYATAQPIGSHTGAHGCKRFSIWQHAQGL
jgi:chitinase